MKIEEKTLGIEIETFISSRGGPRMRAQIAHLYDDGVLGNAVVTADLSYAQVAFLTKIFEFLMQADGQLAVPERRST